MALKKQPKSTDKQNRMWRKYVNRIALFTCPRCKSEYRAPRIENPGEETTQVNCPYGCGFITLEDYDRF